MSAALYPSLVFTVAMMVTNGYFLLGGLPLLVLQHDTPLDANFISAFFRVYYKAATTTSLGAAVSYGLWGKWAFAAGAAGLLLVAITLRRKLVPAMVRIGAQIQDNHQGALRAFRQVHAAALLVNLVQIVVLVWALTQLSL